MMLLVTPSRKPQEGLLGYALRVAEANGYDTPWHVLSMADVVQGQMNTVGFPVRKLATVLGRKPEELDDVAFRREDTKEYQLLGQSLGQGLKYKPLRLRTPAICPHCVEDSHYIDAFWDLNFAVACPIHGTLAVDVCSACGKPLTWFRPGLLQCKCGANLAHITPLPATPAVVELMRLLFAKVHGQASPPDLGGLLPTEELGSLSLRALLDLIGALGGFATSVSGEEGPFSPHQIVSAAAETLQDWPTGYHGLLRRLDEHHGTEAPCTVSLRKRLWKFYLSVFKQRGNAPEFSFLRDEFVRFGLLEWGGGLIDRRMTKGVEVVPRFVSRNELARLVGVDSRTLGNWARLGKISFNEVSTGKSGMRYVGDLTVVQIPQEADGRYLRLREAAKLAGLPVSVLQSLKRSGHYGVKHMPAHKWGFHEADLRNFTQLLLGKSALVSKETIPAHALSLDYVMKQLRFWSEDGKARVIAGYLDGEVQPIGRLDDSIGSIHFAKDDIDTLARKGRADASLDAISQHEAAEWIDCDPMAVQGLAKNGLLVAVHGRHRTRIMRRTVEAFVSRYVSLSGLANELTTTVLKLKNLCKSLSINVMLITRTTAKHSAFIARDRMEALVSALNDSRPEKRQTSIELLTQYLVYLRQTGQPLPRKGAVPNRAAIAYACGFDRNVLYDNKPVIQALQEFDEEDALRHALRPRIAPFEELRRYLENLRQSDAPLPCRKGKPNKVAIARAVGFKRDVLYTDPRFDRLIESYLNSTDPRQALRASNHNLSSEN